MDTQHPKRRSRNGINAFAAADFQIFEKQKSAHCRCQRKQLIGISYPIIWPDKAGLCFAGEIRNTHHAQPRKQKCACRCYRAEFSVLKPILWIQAEICCHKIDHTEPCDIVESRPATQRWDQCVDHQTPCQQQSVFLFRQGRNKLVQKRDQKIKQQETRRKAIRDRFEQDDPIQKAFHANVVYPVRQNTA